MVRPPCTALGLWYYHAKLFNVPYRNLDQSVVGQQNHCSATSLRRTNSIRDIFAQMWEEEAQNVKST